jgi:diamine N-acetyltransferase
MNPTLHNELVRLRPLEPEDLEWIYQLENDESVWEASHTQTPYSRFLIKQYLENAHLDIYEAKQLRLVIENSVNHEVVGLIDLFEFDPQHRRAGIGILITEQSERGKGFGKAALRAVVDYAFTKLHLHQLYANIDTENTISLRLFTTFGFREVGIKKEWILRNQRYLDEALYQLINPLSV